MRIAILADTHFKKNSGQLERLAVRLSQTDLVIHAGDYCSYWVVDYLRTNYNFIGVWGNVDDKAIKDSLPEKEILSVDSYRIGIIHGHGKQKTTIERAVHAFIHDSVDAIIFGHSHQPLIASKNKIIMLNPGSLTQKRHERWFSYILLTVNAGNISTELIFFDELHI